MNLMKVKRVISCSSSAKTKLISPGSAVQRMCQTTFPPGGPGWDECFCFHVILQCFPNIPRLALIAVV